MYHGDGDRFKVIETILPEYRLEVRVLGEVDGAALVIMLDFNAKEPVKLAQISDFDMLGNSEFEIHYQCH